MAGLAAFVTLPLLGASTPAASAAPSLAKSADRGFSDPQPVTIAGYAGSAMEPFISRDGNYLFFNTSNQSPDIATLQYATRASSQSFAFQGPMAGANDPSALSGTPSMDDNGLLYFVSPRSYDQTLATVYAGQFADGQLTGLHLVPGVSAGIAGTVDFDVEVSAAGDRLYVSVGQFGGGSAPSSAHLALFDQQGSGFVPDPHSARLLHAVNKSGALTYAASISTNGLELFFTRDTPAS
ncbi:MAG TPA: hypothetical protein VGG23_01840, partial [Acidimicrobiales bacterium]